jgi:hypothetical protein
MSEHERHEVARLVSVYLRDCHPGGVSLQVDEQGVHEVRCQWYVPIRPSREPTERYEYYEALADVAVELQEREHLNVFLVPSDPSPVSADEEPPSVAEGHGSADPGLSKRKRKFKGTRQRVV